MEKTLLLLLESPSKEKHLHHSLLNGFQHHGFRVKIVYFSGKPEESSLNFPKEFLAEEPVYKKYNLSVFKNFLSALRREKNAKILLVQRHKLLVYALFASFFEKFSLIYHVQSTNVLRNFKRRSTLKLFNKRIDAVVAVSKGVKSYLLHSKCFEEEKIKLIYNGIDTSLFEVDIDQEEARRLFSLPQRSFLFGMSARFKKAKDHKGLVRAFGLLKQNERDENVKLVLAGNGPTRPEIERKVVEMGLSKDVIMLDWISPGNIPLFLKALDVFVHPSWREGIPTAVLEAMAARLPVITTDAEGLPDIFDSRERFGFMVPRGRPEALANAMREVLKLKPEERKKWGEKAFRRVKEGFSSERMVKDFVSLLDDISAS